MDIQKYLIIIKNEDKTSEILSFTSDKEYINIKYKNNEKTYTYSRHNFEFYKNPVEVNMQDCKFVSTKAYMYNIEKIIKFDKYFRIFFKDNISKVIPENELQILKQDDKAIYSINKFEYFKDISKIVSIKTEEGNSLLTNEYEKIDYIPRDTALYRYINPKETSNAQYTRCHVAHVLPSAKVPSFLHENLSPVPNL